MNFKYAYQSKTLFYNGFVFDSTLELKYVLSIEDTHAWLRNGIEIYYGINVQPSGIKTKLNCYRPDFLIRNLSTYNAELIEIKPDGFTKKIQRKRAKIVSRFIQKFAYDWSFHIVTESEIILSSKQLLRYKEIIATQADWRHQPCMTLLQNKTQLTDQDYERFVRTGLLPALVP